MRSQTSVLSLLCVLLLAFPALGRAAQTVCASGPHNIPDPGLISFSVDMPSVVESVSSVTIQGLSHTWMGDLVFTLEDPNGNQYPIFAGDSSNDFVDANFVFEDGSNGAPAYPTGGVVPDGTYAAGHPLENIAGPSGSWSLVVEDTFGADSGSFDEWCLEVNDYSCILDANCTSATEPVCINGACVECGSNSDCGLGEPVCVNNACAECSSDSHCTDPSAPACVNNACAECSSDSHCTDPSAPVCVSNACTCLDHSDCIDSSLPVCEAGVCVPDVCGNGLRFGSEECDDGATQDDDGCSASCEFEGPLAEWTKCASGPFLVPSSGTSGEDAHPVNIPSFVDSVYSVSIQGLSHTWMDDLDFYLEDPSGARYEIFAGDSSNDFVDANYVFVDESNGDGQTYPTGGVVPNGIYWATHPLESVYGGSGNWSLIIVDTAGGDSGSFDEWCLTVNSPSSCLQADKAACSPWATCDKTSGTAVCTCKRGFEDLSDGDGTVCADINECLDETIVTTNCHVLAECDNTNGSFACMCPDGFIGDGGSCSNNAWSIRTVLDIPNVGNYKPHMIEELKLRYAMIVTGETKLGHNDSIVEAMPVFHGTWRFGSRLLGIQHDSTQPDVITMFALFETEDEATTALANMTSPDWASMGATSVEDGPDLYRWTGGSTSDPVEAPPTGLEVDAVWFDPTCLQSGCWTADVTYTAGIDAFNVFFLPRAEAADNLSYDPIYTDTDGTWPKSPADTFFPANHPCTSVDYNAGVTASGGLPASITSCCIPEFLAMYRPVEKFGSALASIAGLDLDSICSTGARDRPVTSSTLPWFVAYGQTPDPGTDSFPPPASPSTVQGVFVDGVFSGMPFSRINHTEVVDAFIGIYKARLFLDEVELRTMAGQLRGTVGVEHTVDTFVGLANFGMTGAKVLDTSAVQVNIHLEKTSYFSVSTHGVNDYTFLQYVNMRLVAVYNQDRNFSGAGESADRTVRTDSTAAAHYIQVTFTLGSKYAVNENSGLIPLDSVRAGKGTFFDDVQAASGEAGMVHKCLQWTSAPGYSFPAVDGFNTTLRQDCAPGASMCVSPASIPDSFASFNIPLGVDWYDTTPEGQAETLSNNVFVHMVISAVDTQARAAADPTDPNAGEAPWQMKTTLSASIPVVRGGVNIFCDGITAKTDLKDVANADIVVGSAVNASELSRLRIKADIASTQLAPDAITEINSDSIEAGLMTLVLKGNSSYFATNLGLQGMSLELEDLVTIHIMEDSGRGEAASVVDDVMALVTAAPADNSDTAGLITDGYALNDAFYFTIDRAAQRAHLEPSEKLLDLCPFNPPRPTAGNLPLETCVLRRDVRYRDYPWRTGGKSTAMELCANVNANKQGQDGALCPTSTGSAESQFFATIFGNNDYAKQLAIDYAAAIAEAYDLNGRFRRAFWVNPGYEWTPTQTGGASLFTVSQKMFLFALITLDEGIGSLAGKSITDSSQFSSAGPKLTRRMLLQSASDGLKDAQASVGADAFAFEVTPKSMMAKAFDVPEDKVALFTVEMELTLAEACMAPTQLQSAIQSTFVDFLSTTASSFHTVQVVSMTVDMGTESCEGGARRSLRTLLFSSASATVEMMLVFTAGSKAQFDQEGFSQMAGIAAVTADPRNSPKVVIDKLECKDDDDCGQVKHGEGSSGSGSGSGSDSTPLIAGVAGGVGGVLLVGGAALLYKHSRNKGEEANIETIQAVNINDLKSQLQDDV